MLIEVDTPQKVKFLFDSNDIYWIQENNNYYSIFMKPTGHQIQISPNSKIKIYNGKESSDEATIEQITKVFIESRNQILLRRE